MRTVSMRHGFVLLLACGYVQAQTTTLDDCDGNECFSPAFDVGVVYQSPVGYYGITALMYAVEINDLARVESLLASGANVNARNDSGATALLMAAAYGSNDIVDRLLAAGADPDIGSHRGDTPLGSAINSGHTDIAVALLEHGANPEGAGLAKAAVLGQTDVVELLLELGVDTPETSLQALSLALWKHHEDIAALLLETNVDLNKPTYDTNEHTRMQTGELVLHTAAEQGLQASTTMLLAKGADVNGRNVHGESALYFAVREDHPAVVSTLLNAGAKVVGQDVAAAIAVGNEETTQQLVLNLDTSTMDVAALENLIVQADKTNNTEFVNRLFSALDSRVRNEPVTTLLFAKANTDDCELVQWDLTSGREQTVFSRAGQCDQSFFYNRSRLELYVLEGDEVSVTTLGTPVSATRSIKLPTAMIDEIMVSLTERLKSRAGAALMSASVVQVGVLESGELAVATHSTGPADETYAYLYAMTGVSWQLVRNMDCHRFDPCRFGEVRSRSLHERPSDMTVWSPEIRRNPYFVDKTETEVLDYEYTSRNGIVTMSIDGQHLLLRYGIGQSEHCWDDCVYTSGVSLELPEQGIVKIADYGGNNAIVDRYALVWTGNWPKSKLIDLGTGKSVFGELQVAGWLH